MALSAFPVRREGVAEVEGSTFDPPEEIGCFSVDGNLQFVADEHQKRYLSMPEQLSGLSVDLNEGYENAVLRNPERHQTLHFLLKWILLNKEDMKKRFSDIDFVFTRGTLSTLSTTAYRRCSWSICATKYKGVIYLTSFDTEDYLERLRNLTEEQRRRFYWRYRFRDLMTNRETTDEHDTISSVNEKEIFSVVLTSRLNQHSLLYFAAVDAFEPGTDSYEKLVLFQMRDHRRQLRLVAWESLIHWWSLCFFAGISRLTCGLHEMYSNGILSDIVTCQTSDLPAVSRNYWTTNDVLGFCDRFLAHVKDTVVEDDPEVVYCFRREVKGATITCERLESPSVYQVLPEWYTSEF